MSQAGPANSSLRSLVGRTWRSAVLWSWGFNALRFGSVLLLLPLLLQLPDPDFGFYYLVLSIVAITPLIDFGFAASVERSVSYATGGASGLVPHGAPRSGSSNGEPNYTLLWKLVYASRVFYRLLSLLLMGGLSTIGTVIVWQAVDQTSSSSMAWFAWAVAVCSAGFEVYSSWWNAFLRGMNQVVASNRILFVAYGLKLALACSLLLMGAGLVSVFAAGLLSSAIVRRYSRRRCLDLLGERRPAPDRPELFGMFRTLWPNSWRVGLQLLSTYLTAMMLSFYCFRLFGLSGNAQYGLSIQIAIIIQAMAMVWVHVKWPRIGQLRSQGDYPSMQRILWPRVWLSIATFIFLGVLAVSLGPLLLEWSNTGKELLPRKWFVVLLLYGFLETHMIIWGTFLTTENKVPTLWPIVTTNVLVLGLVYYLTRTTDLGFGAFVLAPLISGTLFNYWFWAREGARNLRTSWARYMFTRLQVRT